MPFDPLIIPAIIFAGTSFILQHFFEDSDRHRVICMDLRAKYFLNFKGPLAYIDKAKNDKKDKITVEVIQDYLRYRLVKVHFGVINAIIFFGFSFLIAVLVFLITICFDKETVTEISKYIAIFLIILAIGCLGLQFTFARQNYVTGWFLYHLKESPIENYGSFEKQCETILERTKLPDRFKVKKLGGGLVAFSDYTSYFYRKVGALIPVITLNFLSIIFVTNIRSIL